MHKKRIIKCQLLYNTACPRKTQFGLPGRWKVVAKKSFLIGLPLRRERMEICHIVICIYLGYGCTTKSFTEPSNKRGAREYVFTSTRPCVRQGFTDSNQWSELAHSVFLFSQIIYYYIYYTEHRKCFYPILFIVDKLTDLI